MQNEILKNREGAYRKWWELRATGYCFYPKFHCELNPIETYWCQGKWYTKGHCDFTLEGLRKTVPLALNGSREVYPGVLQPLCKDY